MRQRGDGPAAGPVVALLIGSATREGPARRPDVLRQEARVVVLDAGMGPARITRPLPGGLGGQWAHLAVEGALIAEYAPGGPAGTVRAALQPPAYKDVEVVTLDYAEQMGRALRTLSTGLYKLQWDLGGPADWAEYALRAAQVLKIRRFARWDPDRQDGPRADGGLPAEWHPGALARGTVTPLTAAGAAEHARAAAAAFTAAAAAAAGGGGQ